MKVKNLNGTSNKSCKCGSWTKHWESYAEATYWPQRCCVKGCDTPPQVGAHIKKVGVGDNKHYILLMCRAHNNAFGAVLEVESYVKFAHANIRATCTPGWRW